MPGRSLSERTSLSHRSVRQRLLDLLVARFDTGTATRKWQSWTHCQSAGLPWKRTSKYRKTRFLLEGHTYNDRQSGGDFWLPLSFNNI